MTAILRYTAFTDDPDGGNPAGVVLDASELTDARMQEIAAELGYSETAFATSRDDGGYDVRYFSPRGRGPVLRARDDRHRASRSPSATAPGRAASTRRRARSRCDTQRRQRLGHRDAHERRPPRRGRRRPTCSHARSHALRWSDATSSTRRSRRGSASPAPAT